MGRPKGSRNKPKVENTSIALKKVVDTSVALPKVKIGTEVETGEVAQDPNEVIIHDATTKDSGPVEIGLKRPTKNLKHVIEKVDFLVGEVKNLRAYIRRLEDSFVYENGKKSLPEGSDFVSPVKRRKRQVKPLTNVATPDKIETVLNKE